MRTVNAALNDAKTQLGRYRGPLLEKGSDPERLRCFAIVAIGFERLVALELERP